MGELYKYRVPGYFREFKCKGPDCRSTCCKGWAISVSMKEYFRLLGMECSPELRRRLDGAFHVVQYPTDDRYAQITPNWQGDCPLHLENGFCGLQCECGEEGIPAICRLYPRGVHAAYAREISCSNSCEAVMERLLTEKEPMRFEWMELDAQAEDEEEVSDALRLSVYAPLRELIIGALQNRRYELCDRLTQIGCMLEAMHRAILTGSSGEVSRALALCADMTPPDRQDPDDRFAVHIQYRMAELFSRYSANVEPFARAACAALGLDIDSEPDAEAIREAAVRYRETAAHFKEIFPDWPRMFEQMLVNHVFFSRFPFADRHENMLEEHLSLCAAYAFVRFLAVGWMADKQGIEPLADVCAAAFRLIDHSSFDRNAAVLLESLGARRPENMARLALI